MRKKIGNALLAFTAAALVLTVNVGNAGAYFTTYVEAQGGAVVHLGDETTIDEEVREFSKTVVIENKAGSDPVYVRARAYAGNEYVLTYSGDSWLRPSGDSNDGFYIYYKILSGGEKTDALLIEITNGKEKNKTFDVVVIYESIPVQYDENGEILEPVVDGKANPEIKWDQKLEVIESRPSRETNVTPEQPTNPDEPSTPATNPDVPPESSESTEQSQEPSGAEQESGTVQDTESDNGGEG